MDRKEAWSLILRHRRTLRPPKPKRIPVYINQSEKKRRIYYRSKIWKAFKHGLHRRSAEKLLGCSLTFFRAYIQEMLRPGMSMNNYGKRWHLDHIMPCREFDLFDEKQRGQCFHHTNYQPLLSRENKHKAGRLDRYAAQLPLLVHRSPLSITATS